MRRALKAPDFSSKGKVRVKDFSSVKAENHRRLSLNKALSSRYGCSLKYDPGEDTQSGRFDDVGNCEGMLNNTG